MSNLTRHIFSQPQYRVSNYTDRSPKPSESSKYTSLIPNEPTNAFCYTNSNEKPTFHTSSRSPKPVMGTNHSRSKSPFSAQQNRSGVQEKTAAGYSRVSEAELQEASDTLKKLKEKMKNFSGAKTPTKRGERVHTMNDEVENVRNIRGFEVEKNITWRERIKTPEKVVQKPLIQAKDHENQNQEKKKVFKPVVENNATIQAQKSVREQRAPQILTSMNVNSDKKGRITPSIQDIEPSGPVVLNRRQSKSPINSRNNTIIRTENRSRSPIGGETMNFSRRGINEHTTSRREEKSPVNGDRSIVMTPLHFRPEKPTKVESLFENKPGKDPVGLPEDFSQNPFEAANRSSHRRENILQRHFMQSKSRERSPINESKPTIKFQVQPAQEHKADYPSSSPLKRLLGNITGHQDQKNTKGMESQTQSLSKGKKSIMNDSDHHNSQYENIKRPSRRENLIQKGYTASRSRERSPINEAKSSNTIQLKQLLEQKIENPASSPVPNSKTGFFKSKMDFTENESINKTETSYTEKKEDTLEMNPAFKPNLQRGAFSKPTFKPMSTPAPKQEVVKVETRVETRVETFSKAEPFNTENEVPDDTESLIECPQGCGRRFFASVLPKHEKICVKIFQSKRKQFDIASQRLTEDQADLFDNKPTLKTNKNKKKVSDIAKAVEKQAKWKQQSEAFRANLKASRGETLTKEEEMVRNNNDDLIQCEYCMRRFNEQAAQRHIAFCKNKHKLEAVKRSSKVGAKK